MFFSNLKILIIFQPAYWKKADVNFLILKDGWTKEILDNKIWLRLWGAPIEYKMGAIYIYWFFKPQVNSMQGGSVKKPGVMTVFGINGNNLFAQA